MMNLIVVAASFAQGIGVGTEAVMKLAISTGSHVNAVSYYRIMGFFTVLIASGIAVSVFIFQDSLFVLYTSEEDILKIFQVQALLPLCILGGIMFRSYIMGAIKALNLGKHAFFMNLGANCLNAGLIYLFAWHLDKDIQGLWLAKGIFEGVLILMLLAYLWRADW